MAKIPHLDFSVRNKLDGSEEVYTQNQNYNPKEQKFTVDALKDHILQFVTGENIGTKGEAVFYKKINNKLQFRHITGDFFIAVKSDDNNVFLSADPVKIGNNISLQDLKDVPKPSGENLVLQWDGTAFAWITASGTTAPPAENGLNIANSKYELGGELTHNTSIDVKGFEFGIGKASVRHKFTNTNPYWTNGNESSFLETENTTTDTQSFIGVTNSNFGSFSHIWSRKPQGGSFAYLQQNWASTSMKSQDGTSNTFAELSCSFTGTSMKCFENGDTATAGTLSVGTSINEYKRVANGSEINLLIKGVSQSSNELEVLLKGLPVYSNQNSALADNYPVEGLYRTPNGEVRVVT